MSTDRITIRTGILATTLLVAGCADGGERDAVGDKAGNPAPPTTLTLVTSEQQGRPGGDMVERFVATVDELSDGQIVIVPTFDHPSDQPPGFDQINIRALRDGDFDLGLVPARAWHSAGVTSLEPLQLPFVVETDEQADRVAADEQLTDALLGGLGSIDVTGLGLLPEGLRHLVRLDGTPISPTGDLDGLTVRAPTSDTTWAILEALGAEVIDLGAAELNDAVIAGQVTVAETSLLLSSTLTAIGRPSVLLNISLYTKFNVLAISDASLAELDEDAAAVLHDAAAAVLTATLAERPREADGLADACAIGISTVLASDAERQVLRAELAPAIESLTTAADIEPLVQQVRDVAGEATGPELSGCPTGDQPDEPLPSDVAALRPIAGDLPNGTYRVRVDVDTILATYPDFQRSLDGNAGVYTAILDDGHLTLDAVIDNGTTWHHVNVYEVHDDVATFALPSGFDFYTPIAVHWRWSVEPDGALSFEPVGELDRGLRVDYMDLLTVPEWERID
jgi:TRAP-type C4-dicarboxylate transport system substrate-binding protein